MYLSILNLPREIHNKQENMVIVGILLVLGKEPSSLNTFLEPLVNELQILWTTGEKINTALNPNGIMGKAAFVCCAADIQLVGNSVVSWDTLPI